MDKITISIIAVTVLVYLLWIIDILIERKKNQ